MTNERVIKDFLLKCVIIDTESTGLDPKTAEVCELGVASFDDDLNLDFSNTLFGTENPIPLQATNKNNITDKMVEGLETFKSTFDGVQIFGSDKVIVAHNIAYDRTILSSVSVEDTQWLCTYRLAKKLLPVDAENPDISYGLNYLRYFLDVDTSKHEPIIQHRAGPDAYVCGLILQRLVEIYVEISGIEFTSADELQASLLDFIETPIEITIMPFGKHKGKPFKEIPMSYFVWMIDNSDILKEDGDNYDKDLAISIQTYLESTLDS